MRMKDLREIRTQVSTSGVILIVFIVVALSWSLGVFMSGIFGKGVTFTKEEFVSIEKAYEVYGDDITVTKDKNGNLIINILGEEKNTKIFGLF